MKLSSWAKLCLLSAAASSTPLAASYNVPANNNYAPSAAEHKKYQETLKILQDLLSKIEMQKKVAEVEAETSLDEYRKASLNAAQKAYADAKNKLPTGGSPKEANQIAVRFCQLMNPKSINAKIEEAYKDCPVSPELNADYNPEELKAKKKIYDKKAAELTALEQQFNQMDAQLNKWKENEFAKVQGDGKKPVAKQQNANVVQGNKNTCNLDNKEARAALADGIFNNACVRKAGREPSALAGKGTSLSEFRGLTTELSFGKSGNLINLNWKDTKSFRRLVKQEDDTLNKPRKGFTAYSVGVESKADDTGSFATLFTLENNTDDPLRGLDQLSSSLAVTGSYSKNFYKRETPEALEKRAKAMYQTLRAECEKDKSRPMHFCRGNYLIQWIFAKNNETGNYADITRVERYNKVYWGVEDTYPLWGLGATGRVAVPTRDYFNLTTLVDGKPKFDPTLLKTEDFNFFNSKIEAENKRRFTFLVGGFIYGHNTGKPSKSYDDGFEIASKYVQKFNGGTTYKLAGSFKRDFEDLKERTICKAQAADTIFEANENCRKTLIRAPLLKNTFIPSFEIRQVLKNVIFFSKVAFAPKISYDTTKEQYLAELPVYFSVGNDDLTAGISLNRFWDVDKNESETGVRLFIGKTFSLDGSN